MNKFLSANLQVWHLLVGVGVIALSTACGVVMAGPGTLSGSGAKSEAVVPAGFTPPGTFRMATAASNTSITVHSADGDVALLSTTFTVPAGQKANLAAFFNAEAYKYPNGYCYLTFFLDTLGSTPLQPGELWVVDGYIYAGAYPTISAQGFRNAIGPGAHTLYVALHATGGDCFVDDRSLIVMANLHT